MAVTIPIEIKPPAPTPRTWTCPRPACRELLRIGEASCWRCGAPRPDELTKEVEEVDRQIKALKDAAEALRTGVPFRPTPAPIAPISTGAPVLRRRIYDCDVAMLAAILSKGSSISIVDGWPWGADVIGFDVDPCDPRRLVICVDDPSFDPVPDGWLLPRFQIVVAQRP